MGEVWKPKTTEHFSQRFKIGKNASERITLKRNHCDNSTEDSTSELGKRAELPPEVEEVPQRDGDQ